MNEINIDSIDLNLVRVFVAVYEEKSATRAGLRLNQTQSAVSASLAKLRTLYSDPLFVRNGRGLTPTLFANQLYPTLREMLERFSQTFELFSSRSGLFNGRTITIGMSDDFELAMGSDMVELTKRIPTCTRLRFVQTNSVLVEEMLLSRSIDLAVTSGGTRSDSVCSVEVGSGNYGCLIDPNTFGTADWNLETYVDRGHILVSSGGYYGLVDEILSSLGKKRRVLVSTSHFSAIPALLTGTNALTTIPRHAAAAITKFSALKAVEHVLSDSEYEVRTMPKTIPTGTSVISDVTFWPSLRLLFGSFLPFPLRLGMFISGTKDIFFDGFKQLFRGKITVEVLDLSSVAIALVMRDFKTAATTALLLGLGESLEEWTRRKTMENLTESLAVNVDTVWIRKDGEDFEVPFSSLTKYDILVVRAGSAIAADGEVVGGDGMVNQVSMTGEPLPVHRTAGNVVFAGTTVEEGELLIRPTAIGSESRLNKIVEFIENSEKTKAGIEAKAMRLADTIVPYSFLLAGVVGAVTRNLAKVAAVLMVDYSCALKLATPIAFLSAMKEAANHKILIKGGKYLEALAQVDTVVFDKTGTLTVSSPKVSCVVPLDSKWSEKEILRMAACLEEHFPHPVARAVVRAAAERHLQHEEEHAEVEYIVGHGIASKLHGERLLIGSRHFVEDDEGVDCSFAQPEIDRIASKGHSVLYFVVGCTLSGLIGVEDPIRPEAKDVIQNLKLLGINNIAMITGDGPRTAANVARRLGITKYFSQVLPTGKSDIVRRMENEGRKVLMIGDGINDSPALSAATVGVTLSDGADLAKEVASVVLLNSDLTQLPVAIELGQKTYRRIEENFQITIGLNSTYLAGGLLGLIMPATGAVLHNVTTLGVAWSAQQPKLAEKYDQEEILELEYSDEALE